MTNEHNNMKSRFSVKKILVSDQQMLPPLEREGKSVSYLLAANLHMWRQLFNRIEKMNLLWATCLMQSALVKADGKSGAILPAKSCGRFYPKKTYIETFRRIISALWKLFQVYKFPHTTKLYKIVYNVGFLHQRQHHGFSVSLSFLILSQTVLHCA